MKTEQHGSSTNYEERKRRLVEIILQDIERVGNNDRCMEDGKGYQKVGRRDKYYINGDRRNGFDDKHQQLSHECQKYYSNIGGPLVSGSK